MKNWREKKKTAKQRYEWRLLTNPMIEGKIKDTITRHQFNFYWTNLHVYILLGFSCNDKTYSRNIRQFINIKGKSGKEKKTH